MILFFDTETNGLPADCQLSPYEPGAWPDVLQIAFQLIDPALVATQYNPVVQESNLYIRQPKDFRFDKKAQAVHNITQDQLDSGYDKEVALHIFSEAMRKANRVVAHNFDFDSAIIQANYYQMTMKEFYFEEKGFCTMKSQEVIDFMGLKKWPRLSALYKKLFECDFDNAHNALNDVHALAKCYFQLVRKGII